MSGVNGQQVINWLAENDVARVILAEMFALALERADEDLTYDDVMINALIEVLPMDAFSGEKPYGNHRTKKLKDDLSLLAEGQREFASCEMVVGAPVKTLRDEFAMAALTGIAGNELKAGASDEGIARQAYALADAIIKVRSGK